MPFHDPTKRTRIVSVTSIVPLGETTISASNFSMRRSRAEVPEAKAREMKTIRAAAALPGKEREPVPHSFRRRSGQAAGQGTVGRMRIMWGAASQAEGAL